MGNSSTPEKSTHARRAEEDLVERLRRSARSEMHNTDNCDWEIIGLLHGAADRIYSLAETIDRHYDETNPLHVEVAKLRAFVAKAKNKAAVLPSADTPPECRHEFKDANGGPAKTCWKCGAPKSPRGRRAKGVQAAVPVRRPLYGDPKCPEGNGLHVPSDDLRVGMCVKCDADVFEVEGRKVAP